MDITGRIFKVLPMVSGTSSRGEWKKQEYVLEYNLDQQYPRKMLFNLWGDNITNNANLLQEGQFVTVSFDIECREYNERWYNDIRAWRIQPAQGGVPAPAQGGQPFSSQQAPFASQPSPVTSAPAQPAFSAAPEVPSQDDGSDLPF